MGNDNEQNSFKKPVSKLKKQSGYQTLNSENYDYKKVIDYCSYNNDRNIKKQFRKKMKTTGINCDSETILREYEEHIFSIFKGKFDSITEYNTIFKWRSNQEHRLWDRIILNIPDHHQPDSSLKKDHTKKDNSDLYDDIDEYKEEIAKKRKINPNSKLGKAELIINSITGNNNGFSLVGLGMRLCIIAGIIVLWLIGAILSFIFGSI